MDRRSSIAAMFGLNKAMEQAPEIMPTGTLSEYSGPWTTREAAHLLRRTSFGPKLSEIQDFVSRGVVSSVDFLLRDLPAPSPPINYFFEDDPFVPIGSTWVEAAYENIQGLQNYRKNSLRAWTVGQMLNNRMSIREKMTLFWHNHFVVADTLDARLEYLYINTLRQNALGNFKELTKLMTVDPSMLVYLNGNQNTNRAPNENYARELLELFTVGKGPLAGPGDYTTFTEDDVIQIARVLTGWRFRLANDGDKSRLLMLFNANLHDRGDKQLSHRFNNAVIANGGEDEYKTLIDVIFQSEHVALHLARKLYRYFLYYKIDESVEADIIQPLAQIIRDNDYDVAPAISVFLKSEHFYMSEHIGCMIKHPMDFYVSPLVQFEIDQIPELQNNYYFWTAIFRGTIPHGMEYFQHPSVAGWKAYYQEPVFYRSWISSVTMPLRVEFTDNIVDGNIRLGRVRVAMDVLGIVAGMSNPTEPNSLINELSDWLFTNRIPDEQRAFFKEILIPGLPDYEWTIEYNDYLSNPGDENLKNAIESKLKALFKAMLRSPDFYLS